MRPRSEMHQEPTVDRLPPHSVEAEEGVIGCCLLEPKECLADAVSKFRGEQVFYDDKCKATFQVMTELQEKLEGIDTITVWTGLKDRGWGDVGLDFVQRVANQVVSSAMLPEYLEIVWGKYLLRRMLAALTESARMIYQEQDERVEELLGDIEAAVLEVNGRKGVVGVRTMAELISATDTLLENMHRGVGIIGGIRTRFGYFDKVTGGLHRKELSILAARPSVGKTSLMFNIASNVARFEKTAVAIFSLEMKGEDLALRARCADAGVNLLKLRTGFPTMEDIGLLSKGAARMANLPVFIDDNANQSITELRAKARRLVNQHNVGLIAVDYLQLVSGTGRYRDNREREVAEISRGLKGMAMELNAAVLVLSQLNREIAKNKWRKPQLEDLRESGAIEQDADLVMMLYRAKTDPVTKQEVDEDANLDEIPVNCLIAKQRNGPADKDVNLYFKKSLTQMRDAFDNLGHRQGGGSHSENKEPATHAPATTADVVPDWVREPVKGKDFRE